MTEPFPPKVFISYARVDEDVARAIRHALEANGIGCWIDRIDIAGGTEWAKEIREGLDRCSVVVVVLSKSANASKEVAKEVKEADERKRPLLVFRIEDVKPGDGLAEYLNKSNWFDAFLLGYRAHLDHLVEDARKLLTPGGATTTGPAEGPRVNDYLDERGPNAHRDYTCKPEGEVDRSYRGVEEVEDLYHKLRNLTVPLPKTFEMTVRGTLFPCALLSSGYFERQGESRAQRWKWKNGLQKWLFHGFDQWAPSWDFTWDLDNWEVNPLRPYYIAQLGSQDEADSIPVLVPGSRAQKLYEQFKFKRGGIEAEVTGLLGHRTHFNKHLDNRQLEQFGGLLNYCLWIDENNAKHHVEPSNEIEIYSGYIWKCVAPNRFLRDGVGSLTDMFFIWEHVNFADEDALQYCLDSMAHKEEYIQKQYGALTLMQKSSALVPGTPALKPHEIYDMLLRGKAGRRGG